MYLRFLHKTAIVALVCLLCGLMLACDKGGSADGSAGRVNMGTVAPNFTLENMQGEEVTLSDLQGKVVLVNFWATWCPPCRQEMPSMESLYRHLKDQGFEMLAINVEKNGPEAVSSFLSDKSHSFPILFDPQAQVQRLYNVSKYPETFVVDRNGIVVEHVVGAIDWMQPSVVEYLENL
ncbi:MAG: TlpA disulfide reductase family protein [Desulfuromonadaceae bacterium]|nr:TlpA disulfide reductase family protein [Desulfuromonadaceae bacterium]